MPLSDNVCKNAHKNEKTKLNKAFKLCDGQGLYLLLQPKADGWSKWWRFKYRFNGKDCLMSLGIYPKISLLEARKRRDIAHKQIANGINPSKPAAGNVENTFKATAEDFLITKKPSWSASHHKHIKECFERNVYP